MSDFFSRDIARASIPTTRVKGDKQESPIEPTLTKQEMPQTTLADRPSTVNGFVLGQDLVPSFATSYPEQGEPIQTLTNIFQSGFESDSPVHYDMTIIETPEDHIEFFQGDSPFNDTLNMTVRTDNIENSRQWDYLGDDTYTYTADGNNNAHDIGFSGGSNQAIVTLNGNNNRVNINTHGKDEPQLPQQVSVDLNGQENNVNVSVIDTGVMFHDNPIDSQTEINLNTRINVNTDGDEYTIYRMREDGSYEWDVVDYTTGSQTEAEASLETRRNNTDLMRPYKIVTENNNALHYDGAVRDLVINGEHIVFE